MKCYKRIILKHLKKENETDAHQDLLQFVYRTHPGTENAVLVLPITYISISTDRTHRGTEDAVLVLPITYISISTDRTQRGTEDVVLVLLYHLHQHLDRPNTKRHRGCGTSTSPSPTSASRQTDHICPSALYRFLKYSL